MHAGVDNRASRDTKAAGGGCLALDMALALAEIHNQLLLFPGSKRCRPSNWKCPVSWPPPELGRDWIGRLRLWRYFSWRRGPTSTTFGSPAPPSITSITIRTYIKLHVVLLLLHTVIVLVGRFCGVYRTDTSWALLNTYAETERDRFGLAGIRRKEGDGDKKVRLMKERGKKDGIDEKAHN